ncbi:MAG TPA: tetratricopeptide repeat protein [Thermoanaerobaculia bacterium]|nr:tetratricopeptide repeat protein [Thermoanaerobaculia bacterium]
MNRDNLLFLFFGFLLGFVGAYLAFEAIAAKQPQRRVAGMADPSASAGPSDTTTPMSAPDSTGAPGNMASGSAAGGAPGRPGMEEIRKLKEYVEQHPEDADAVRKLANLNFDIGNWTRARDLYLQYEKVAKVDADLLTDLGITHRELGESDQALARFRQAEKLAPEHWQSRFNQAIVLGLDLGRYDEAGRVLDQLRRTQPANPEIDRLAAEIEKRRKAAA